MQQKAIINSYMQYKVQHQTAKSMMIGNYKNKATFIRFVNILNRHRRKTSNTNLKQLHFVITFKIPNTTQFEC